MNIHLSKEDAKAVFRALENPAKPNKELMQLWNKYKESGLYDIEDKPVNKSHRLQSVDCGQ